MTNKRAVLCPHCGANLLECGIVEVLEGATTNTEITFSKGSTTYGETLCDELTNQWIVCMCCNKDISTGVSAVDIINFADKTVDSINGLKTKIEVT